MLELTDDLSSNPLRSALDDDWVLYHGTSESYSASIETLGLGHPDGTPNYWDDVQAFISFWRAVKVWSRAFSALVNFSQDHDGIRPVSLGETFGRAARYAKEEPGGETMDSWQDRSARLPTKSRILVFSRNIFKKGGRACIAK